MKKTLRMILTSSIVGLGLFSTLGFTAPIAQAATTDTTTQYQLPHAVQIETGNFYYEISKPIGFQTLEGISPLMLINPDGIIRNSKVRVTMSDGTVLLQYGNENAYYVDQSQVTVFQLK
ncbi:hypothetical protein [Companilactobacillus ginsenosidimutans]|uniref:Surface layer protein A domain-containing protein n=1 Tax=Companilactobacillus ginsenosidimutans TaxID=1007676 RepID=A0A0H4R2X1_9LACO|nr:hypothetical protein [Companilactobacillus ginsenosidimutans]AKP68110.1 hypothetical protein ABM34_11575 [Companilactobacillus ginsenosidimutans]